MAKTKQTKKVKKKVVKPLPKKIRDELILSCALKVYSSLAMVIRILWITTYVRTCHTLNSIFIIMNNDVRILVWLYGNNYIII